MSLTLADNYFIKAYDNYPYDLTEVMEALNYALSYDEEHAGVQCLMGRVALTQLNQLDKAEYHFEKALSYDANYTETYPHYADLLLRFRAYKQVIKLVDYSLTIRGIIYNEMLHKKALALEGLYQYDEAKAILKQILTDSLYNDSRTFYKGELKRIKEKLKKTKEKPSRK